jgi:phospholipid transport system substrate-binding protein
VTGTEEAPIKLSSPYGSTLRPAHLIGILALLACTARPAPAAPPPAETVVREALHALMTTLVVSGPLLAQRPDLAYRYVEQSLMPLADTAAVARGILGRYWRAATPAQRARFERGLHAYMLDTLVHALIERQGDVMAYIRDVRFLPTRILEPGRRAQVRFVFTLKPGVQPEIGLAMRGDGADWRIRDVSVLGLSLVAGFRDTLAAEVRRDGLEAVVRRFEAYDLRLPSAPKTDTVAPAKP